MFLRIHFSKNVSKSRYGTNSAITKCKHYRTNSNSDRWTVLTAGRRGCCSSDWCRDDGKMTVGKSFENVFVILRCLIAFPPIIVLPPVVTSNIISVFLPADTILCACVYIIAQSYIHAKAHALSKRLVLHRWCVCVRRRDVTTHALAKYRH